MLTQDQYCKARIVELSWRWARQSNGGHVAGQLVMHALMNRVRCGWGSTLQIIDRVPNFMAEYEMPPLEHPSMWDAAFVKMLHAVDGIFDGSAPDLSKGALYWGNLADIQRQWFKDLISAENPDTGLRQHPLVTSFGSLSFFK